MSNKFIHQELVNQYGKEYANAISRFKYMLMKHYGIHLSLRRRARTWTLNHVIQIINSHNERILIIPE